MDNNNKVAMAIDNNNKVEKAMDNKVAMAMDNNYRLAMDNMAVDNYSRVAMAWVQVLQTPGPAMVRDLARANQQQLAAAVLEQTRGNYRLTTWQSSNDWQQSRGEQSKRVLVQPGWHQ
jgi:hypothetical protein